MVKKPFDVLVAKAKLESVLPEGSKLRFYRRKYARSITPTTWAWFVEVRTTASHYEFHRILDSLEVPAQVTSGGSGDWTVKLGEYV